LPFTTLVSSLSFLGSCQLQGFCLVAGIFLERCLLFLPAKILLISAEFTG
jgi:hypothetical protein